MKNMLLSLCILLAALSAKAQDYVELANQGCQPVLVRIRISGPGPTLTSTTSYLVNPGGPNAQLEIYPGSYAGATTISFAGGTPPAGYNITAIRCFDPAFSWFQTLTAAAPTFVQPVPCALNALSAGWTVSPAMQVLFN